MFRCMWFYSATFSLSYPRRNIKQFMFKRLAKLFLGGEDKKDVNAKRLMNKGFGLSAVRLWSHYHFLESHNPFRVSSACQSQLFFGKLAQLACSPTLNCFCFKSEAAEGMGAGIELIVRNVQSRLERLTLARCSEFQGSIREHLPRLYGKMLFRGTFVISRLDGSGPLNTNCLQVSLLCLNAGAYSFPKMLSTGVCPLFSSQRRLSCFAIISLCYKAVLHFLHLSLLPRK